MLTLVTNANKFFKENLPAEYAKLVEMIRAAAGQIAPNLDAWLYNWLYQNPDLVIEFFANYSDEMFYFILDNHQIILTVLAFIGVNYGDDIVAYVLENADGILPILVNWVETYGDRAWAMVKVYLNALGVNVDILNPEALLSALNNLFELIAKFGNDFADQAWNKLLNSDVLQGIIATLEGVKNDALNNIELLEAQVKATLVAQLNKLTAELNALKAQLADAIAQGDAALQAQLEAAIAQLEAAIAKIEAEIAKVQAEIQKLVAAVEELVAKIDEISGIVNDIIALVASGLPTDKLLPLLQNAVNELANALIDAIDMAALLDELHTAAKILITNGVNACVDYLKALGNKIVTDAANAIEAAVQSALAQLNTAIQNQILFVIRTINNTINSFLNNALTGEYLIVEDSYYVSIGADNAYYAQLLANKLGLTNDQLAMMGWDNIDLAEIMKADLITLGYDESTITGFAVDQLLGYIADYLGGDLRASVTEYAINAINHFAQANPYIKEENAPQFIATLAGMANASIDDLIANTALNGKSAVAMDWAALIGEDNVSYVDEARAEIRAKLLAAGVPEYFTYTVDVFELILQNADAFGPELAMIFNLFDTDMLRNDFGEYATYTVVIPVVDAMVFSAESYVYSFVSFNKLYGETVLTIKQINPNAELILLGHYNAFDNLTFSIGSITVELGDAYDYVIDATTTNSFVYALLFDNVTYVDIYDAETAYDAYVNAGMMSADAMEFLMAYVSNTALTSPSVAGNYYIYEQILKALSITCSHAYDNACDATCNLCGEIREVADHVYDDCADADCNECGEIREVIGHVYDNACDADCNVCGAIRDVEDHVDADNDHNCDSCGEVLSECADNDDDHLCDLCGATVSECADNDGDHVCDLCGATASECTDNDGDHNCDVCGEVLSECADNNNDHNCDVCGETLSECADDNNNHKCDVCNTVLSQCVDANDNHRCDVCGSILTRCADADGDHFCDLCGKVVSQCADNDNNHNCDVCGEVLSECADNNRNHKCDVCDAVLSQCVDANTDHKCDVCRKALSQCVNTDNDHFCDYCDKVVTPCTDANNDHNCDLCGETLSQCADADIDHYCDVCGELLSLCTDANNNHKCDICDVTVSQCADADNNHKCDVCGAKLTVCADADANNKCDICGTKLVSNIENTTSGVTIQVPSNSQATLPSGTVLDVVNKPDEKVPEQILDNLAASTDAVVEALGIYDLNLLLGGAKIQPNGSVMVTLPAPTLTGDFDRIIVVYLAPDGSYDECTTTVNEDGTISFETDHFSKYAVIGVNDAESGLGAGAIVAIIVGAVLVAGIAGFAILWFVIKKKTWADLLVVFKR